jgi:hypothetical protein
MIWKACGVGERVSLTRAESSGGFVAFGYKVERWVSFLKSFLK